MNYYKIFLLALILVPQSNFAQRFFHTTRQYLDHTLERTDFDESKIIIENFINDKVFMKELLENELYTFYGIAYNDELFSASQLENKSCWGQFLELCSSINKGATNATNKKIKDISYFKNVNFDKDKKTVIFMYSEALSKSSIKTYIKTIKKEIDKDPSFDYIVLSLDYTKIKEH